MPELPEVETIRRDLEPLIVGRTITRVQIHAGTERLAVSHSPRALEKAMTGRRIDGFGRQGKYLLARLDNGQTWVTHLRMTGSLVHKAGDAPAHRFERARIDLDDGTTMRFNDLRKFGTWHIVDDVSEAMPRNGPDAISEDFTPQWLKDKLATRSIAVKSALLDQKVVAGVGNIYADESCWIARVDPRTPANELTPRRVTALHHAVLETLHESLGDRGSSFSDYLDGLGSIGMHHMKVHVFRRDGEPCTRCGKIIQKIKLNGRGTHFCPGCQKGA
ncbi:MAG: bifunctional DNA-formamidopyrimidine glycosylase/DNA-(apurinic or apyrimidinic site) lyase [Chloroflexi bacterium]|nr:MAG: bifunctional DNA-formamidopyrimidine glycosylase/DNA-(apurinic or apyrimidinic site) lyase [Chloroflexota bacterium]